MKLKKLCEGRMLPPIDVGKEHYSALFDLMVKAVERATLVPYDKIMGRSRPRDIADARLMVYKMARHELGVGADAVGFSGAHKCPSLQWIGGKFGRDHGAILHGVNAMSSTLTVDRKLFDVYIKALSYYEISRAEYLSIEVKNVTNLQIHALEETIDTIKDSIKTHQKALADTKESLLRAKGGNHENMVQEQCPSNG